MNLSWGGASVAKWESWANKHSTRALPWQRKETGYRRHKSEVENQFFWGASLAWIVHWLRCRGPHQVPFWFLLSFAMTTFFVWTLLCWTALSYLRNLTAKLDWLAVAFKECLACTLQNPSVQWLKQSWLLLQFGIAVALLWKHARRGLISRRDAFHWRSAP